MVLQLHREIRNGELRRLWLGLDLADAYLEFLHSRCCLNTWINYAHDLKVFFNTIQKSVVAVTTSDVLQFMQSQTQPPEVDPQEEGHPRPVCQRTLKRRLCALSGLYNYLLLSDDPPIKRNPVPSGLILRGSIPGLTARSNPLIRPPINLPQLVPVEQIQRFLSSLQVDRDKAMLLLMILAGLRKSEVLGLELADLDAQKRTVRVRHGKGGRERVCCISELFFQVLEGYLHNERPAVDTPQLFVVLKGPRRGQRLSVSGLNTILAHHRHLAHAPQLTCHRLRHTCLTMLREAGMSLEALQQQAGHQSINTTRIYLHLTNQALRNEYFKVSDSLFSNLEERTHA